jgi:hypothetical protein
MKKVLQRAISDEAQHVQNNVPRHAQHCEGCEYEQQYDGPTCATPPVRRITPLPERIRSWESDHTDNAKDESWDGKDN